jgi:hypothetical protein
MVLEITHCDSFDLVATPLKQGGVPLLQSLIPSSGSWVEISIAELCDVNPMQWPSKRDAIPDKDFKWHFEMLDNAAYTSLKQYMNNLGLELPYPIPKGKPGGRGINCFPTTAPAP